MTAPATLKAGGAPVHPDRHGVGYDGRCCVDGCRRPGWTSTLDSPPMCERHAESDESFHECLACGFAYTTDQMEGEYPAGSDKPILNFPCCQAPLVAPVESEVCV